MTAEWTGEYTGAGKKKYKFVGKALDPRYKDKGQDMIQIPCGKCIGCRLDYSRHWADRMMLELEDMKTGIFVTLTYDSEHLEENWSQYDDNGPIRNPLYLTLVKRHAQNFIKEIRRQFKEKKIRFYLSGEYGELHGRPHYHAILFGLSLDDFADHEIVGRNELGQLYYKSDKLQKIWKKGYVGLSEVSWQTCAYVARYCMKKLNGDMADIYAARNIIPEFSLMSRMPGIGAKYLEKHPDALEYSEINLHGVNHALTIPKYYLRLKEKEDPKFVEKLRKERARFAEDSQLAKLKLTDLTLSEVLDVQRRNKENATRILKQRKGDF